MRSSGAETAGRSDYKLAAGLDGIVASSRLAFVRSDHQLVVLVSAAAQMHVRSCVLSAQSLKSGVSSIVRIHCSSDKCLLSSPLQLPDFLDGLFNMLSDSNREIRQAADGALAEFLRWVPSAWMHEMEQTALHTLQ